MISINTTTFKGGGMFGLNDNNQQQGAQPPVAANDNPTGITPPATSPQGATIMPPPVQPLPSLPIEADPADNPAPATSDDSSNITSGSDVNLEKAYIPTSNGKDEEQVKPSAASLMQSTTQEDDLLKLKQQALQNLAPLVDQLDQSAEEKFKTTMMLIQASDNPDLVQEAYDAANKIQDEKARAHALLDVVNEINYFTQHHSE